ncbi:MAG: DNA-formamidopyrimidine glycosylase family protein [Myxococcota bacterium]|nr:DNA-formamidopyrimidine glycosylase family protein [Myxococcota bacterium]
MPELAEVEHARRILEAACVGERIEAIEVDADDIVIEDRAALLRLRGREVREARRRGKYLWLELDEGPHPIFHLGMTGALRRRGDEPLKLASSAKEVDRTWPPRFTKVRLVMSSGELVYTNKRRLGRVLLRDAPATDAPIGALGFDPWTDMPSLERFRGLLERRRGLLKGLLLNQKFAAGVGNWVADEVLFQSGIDPRRRIDGLKGPEIERLHAALRDVVRLAVEADARAERFPAEWLFHRRWGKDPDARTADGHVVEFIEVAGRTTAWVPTKQR